MDQFYSKLVWFFNRKQFLEKFIWGKVIYLLPLANYGPQEVCAQQENSQHKNACDQQLCADYKNTLTINTSL